MGSAKSAGACSEEARLDELAQRGALRRATMQKEGWTWQVEGVGLPPGTAEGWIETLREER